MFRIHFGWQRSLLIILFALAVFAAVMFAFRAYRSFLLLHSAYGLGAPDVSSVRPQMTLDYVVRTYSVPQAALAERLGHSSEVEPRASLSSLARRQGFSPFDYLQQVQEAIVELRPIASPAGVSGAVAEPDEFGDEISRRCWRTVTPFWA